MKDVSDNSEFNVQDGPYEPGNDSAWSASVGGERFSVALMAEAIPGGIYNEYNLGRHYRQLTATVGVDDGSDSEAVVRVTVMCDGKRLYDKNLVFGHADKWSLAISDCLRMLIRVVPIAPPKGRGDSFDYLVLGDPLVR